MPATARQEGAGRYKGAPMWEVQGRLGLLQEQRQGGRGGEGHIVPHKSKRLSSEKMNDSAEGEGIWWVFLVLES